MVKRNLQSTKIYLLKVKIPTPNVSNLKYKLLSLNETKISKVSIVFEVKSTLGNLKFVSIVTIEIKAFIKEYEKN